MKPPSRLSVLNIEGLLYYKPEMKGGYSDVWVWKPDTEISGILKEHAAGRRNPEWCERVVAFSNEKMPA